MKQQMKINLPKHKIISRAVSELEGSSGLRYTAIKEMPLAYISLSNVARIPHIEIQEDFVQDQRRQVKPFDTFSKRDVMLFDGNNNIVRTTMKRDAGTWYYEPVNRREFSPLSFNAFLEVRRQQQYFNDTIYNIKVSAIETGADVKFLQTLMRLFGDTYRIGYCPQNIRFNGGSLSYTTLSEGDYLNSDFVFIQSHDGIHYGASNEEVDQIDFETMLNNHTNVWLFCDDYAGRFTDYTAVLSDNIILHMKDRCIYLTDNHSIPRNTAKIFDQSIPFIETQNRAIYEYSYVNEAVLTIHVPYKGYVIITPSWFLESIDDIAPVIYETIMLCYLKSYYKSNTIPMWITDQPVDFVAYSNNKLQRNHTKVTLTDFISEDELNNNSYTISDIIVDTPYVRYQGLTGNNELVFTKTGGVTDPVKQSDEVTLYTTSHTVICYKPEDLYTVETPANLEFTTTENSLFLIVHPMISTSKDIYTVADQTFRITDLHKKYSLYVSKGSSSVRNVFTLLQEEAVPADEDIKVADIFFTVEEDISVSDARILGGGLPENQRDDYDMTDIGHALGRPYRTGSSLVIRLPAKTKNFESRIRKELDKHIAAGDDYVLIFEKKN